MQNFFSNQKQRGVMTLVFHFYTNKSCDSLSQKKQKKQNHIHQHQIIVHQHFIFVKQF